MHNDVVTTVINQAAVLRRSGPRFRSWLAVAVGLFGTTVAACSVNSVFAQSDPNQLADRYSLQQRTISKNQMLTPEKALRATDRARKELIDGHLDLAQKQISQALDIAPHCGVALSIQGLIDAQMDHLDEAAISFQEAINNDPTLGSAYLGLGMVLIGQGHFRNSLVPLDRATALLPSAWIVYLEIGLANLGIGNTEGALAQANLADSFTDNDKHGKSGVAFLRALIQIRLQDVPHARAYLIQTINYEPHGCYASLARKDFEGLLPHARQPK